MPLQLRVFRVDTYAKHRPNTKAALKSDDCTPDASVPDTIVIHECVKKISSTNVHSAQ